VLYSGSVVPMLELFVLPGSSIPATVTKNFFLHRFHFARGSLRSIVKPVQM
jgi:hypothetical protein